MISAAVSSGLSLLASSSETNSDWPLLSIGSMLTISALPPSFAQGSKAVALIVITLISSNQS